MPVTLWIQESAAQTLLAACRAKRARQQLAAQRTDGSGDLIVADKRLDRGAPCAAAFREVQQRASGAGAPNATHAAKSVDADSALHVSVSAATYAFFSAMAFKVSVPSGRRSGGVGASASVTRAFASFSGSPGWF